MKSEKLLGRFATIFIARAKLRWDFMVFCAGWVRGIVCEKLKVKSCGVALRLNLIAMASFLGFIYFAIWGCDEEVKSYELRTKS